MTISLTSGNAFERIAQLEALLSRVVSNTQTDSYTLVLTDAGKCIIMNKGVSK